MEALLNQVLLDTLLNEKGNVQLNIFFRPGTSHKVRRVVDKLTRVGMISAYQCQRSKHGSYYKLQLRGAVVDDVGAKTHLVALLTPVIIGWAVRSRVATTVLPW